MTVRTSWMPQALAALVAVMGLTNIVSALLAYSMDRHRLLRDLVPLDLTHLGRTLAAIAGIGLLVVAHALWRGKRTAWLITLGLLLASAGLHLLKGLDWEEASGALLLLVVLFRKRACFTRRSDPPTLRRLPTLLIGGLALIGLYGLLGFVLLAPYLPGVTWTLAIQELVARIVWSDGPFAAVTGWRVRWFLQSLSLLSLMLASTGLLLLLRPVLPRSLPAGDRRRAADLVRQFGTSSLAPFALDGDTQHYLGETVAGIVAYKVAAGVAVVLGDPVAAPEAVGALAREFVDFCARQDWHVCFYEVQPRHLPDYAPLGMQIVKIGEDAWIDLAAFTLIGAAMADVRHAVNKSVRDGLRVHQLDPAHDADLWHQVQLIEAGWRAAQGGLMIGFSIGHLPALADPETCSMLALGPDARRVLAYCTFRPIPAIGGWALDTMRRAPGAPNGTLEFLIARSLEGFRAAGAARVSLGLAPLAQGDAPGPTRLDAAIRALANNPHVNAVYGYRGLLFFKRKFNPTWRGGYLLYPGVVNLPTVVAAVLQVHIPALGPQLALKALRDQAVGLAARMTPTRKRRVQVGAE